MLGKEDRLKQLQDLREKCQIAQALWVNDVTEVGDFTYGTPVVHVWEQKTRLKIGKFCSIGGGVQILLGGEHHTDWVTTYPFDVLLDGEDTASKGDVIIGNDVWIGDNVTILSGVTIGDGAVIGAGSVVTKYVPSYEIFAGVPARFIRYRRIALNAHPLAWWDWPLEKIAEAYPLIRSGDVKGLFDYARRWE